MIKEVARMTKISHSTVLAALSMFDIPLNDNSGGLASFHCTLSDSDRGHQVGAGRSAYLHLMVLPDSMHDLFGLLGAHKDGLIGQVRIVNSGNGIHVFGPFETMKRHVGLHRNKLQ